MDETLFERLIEYNRTGPYPFCMPGHKRRLAVPGLENPYEADITEVPGFDDLHRPEGVLKEIMDEAADIYGCRHAYISVNGSTACNLAAVTSVPAGGPVLAAANCHRSVFNAIKINKRKAVLIEPEKVGKTSLSGGILPASVERAFCKNPDIRAFVVTSPTYEGFTSDIGTIADIVHSHGALLIADEAHGAHFPFSGAFPESSLYLGADIVVQSMHKTMGSLNQTAWLFAPGEDDAFAEDLHKNLLLYTTTSPSYLLMGSMHEALRRAVSPEGKAAFAAFAECLERYAAEFAQLRNIHFIDRDIEGNYGIVRKDPSRLVFTSNKISGAELTERLVGRGVQPERCGADFVSAISTVYDTEEGFALLLDALKQTDKELD